MQPSPGGPFSARYRPFARIRFRFECVAKNQADFPSRVVAGGALRYLRDFVTTPNRGTPAVRPLAGPEDVEQLARFQLRQRLRADHAIMPRSATTQRRPIEKRRSIP